MQASQIFDATVPSGKAGGAFPSPRGGDGAGFEQVMRQAGPAEAHPEIAARDRHGERSGVPMPVNPALLLSGRADVSGLFDSARDVSRPSGSAETAVAAALDAMGGQAFWAPGSEDAELLETPGLGSVTGDTPATAPILGTGDTDDVAAPVIPPLDPEVSTPGAPGPTLDAPLANGRSGTQPEMLAALPGRPTATPAPNTTPVSTSSAAPMSVAESILPGATGEGTRTSAPPDPGPNREGRAVTPDSRPDHVPGRPATGAPNANAAAPDGPPAARAGAFAAVRPDGANATGAIPLGATSGKAAPPAVPQANAAASVAPATNPAGAPAWAGVQAAGTARVTPPGTRADTQVQSPSARDRTGHTGPTAADRTPPVVTTPPPVTVVTTATPTVAVPPTLPDVTEPDGGGRVVKEDYLGSLDEPTSTGVTGESRTGGIANHRAAADVTTMRNVSAQLTDVARRLPDGPVQVSLDPEELGRVKMTLSATDGTMSVNLAVERSETADLLRRHLETLAQDFRELGYADVTFTFDGEGDPEADGEQRDAGRRAADAPSATEDTAPPVRGHRTDGVDIRL